MKISPRFALAISAVLLSGQAMAHHSSAPHFDANTPLQIEGVITKFRFVNPHAYLYIDVRNSDGSVSNWNCEMSAASALRRFGWTKELFSPGQTISIDGIAARRDPLGCSFQSGELGDGTTFTRNGPLTRGGAATSVASVESTADDETFPFSGLWQTQPRRRGGGRPGGGGQAERPGGGANRFDSLLTDEGRAALENYDQRFDDPALECSPSSIIRGWSEPNSVSRIEYLPDQITIRHEFMDTVRTVHLDTREHPSDVEAGLTGHSVGWVQDDVLIIETTGFAAGVLLPHPGLLHTSDMRVVERLILSADGQQLTREYEVNDPRYLKEPFTGRSIWNRTDIPLTEYNCIELSGVSKERPEDI